MAISIHRILSSAFGGATAKLRPGQLAVVTNNGVVTGIVVGDGRTDTDNLPSTTIGLNVEPTAAAISVDAEEFSGNLSSTDTDLQKVVAALDALDLTEPYEPANPTAAVWGSTPPTTPAEALDLIAAFLETP